MDEYRYKWATTADPYLNAVDPNVAVACIAEYTGKQPDDALQGITAETLWREVRTHNPIFTPIRAAFEWDNTVALDKYGVIRARKLLGATIRYKYTIEKDTSPPIRQYVYTVLPDAPPTYVHRDVMKTHPDAREYFIASKWKALRAWTQQTADMDEFNNVRLALIPFLDQ